MRDFPPREQEPSLPFTEFDEHNDVELVTPRQRTRKGRTTPKPALTPVTTSIRNPLGNSHQSYSTMEESKCIMRELSRGTPGEPTSRELTPKEEEMCKKRTQYYDDIFNTRGSYWSARERVRKDSMVIADLRTSVIIRDEHTFTTELSSILSVRYNRPETSILVTITHSAYILLGGNFDAAYTLNITALPSQVDPVTNRWNAFAIQTMLEESLKVPPSRGIIKFIPLPEENFAFNGTTYQGQIEDLEKERAHEFSALRRTFSRSGFKNSNKKKSLRNMKSQKMSGGAALSPHPEQAGYPVPQSPRALASGAPPPPTTPLPAIPQGKISMDKKTENVQKMSRKKSFMAGLFGR